MTYCHEWKAIFQHGSSFQVLIKGGTGENEVGQMKVQEQKLLQGVSSKSCLGNLKGVSVAPILFDQFRPNMGHRSVFGAMMNNVLLVTGCRSQANVAMGLNKMVCHCAAVSS